jgi:hypothetical protein
MPWYWLVFIIALLSSGIFYYRTARRRILREVILFEVRFVASTMDEILSLRLHYKAIRGNRAKFQKALEEFFLKRYAEIKKKNGWKKLFEEVRGDREGPFVPQIILDAISGVLRSEYFHKEFNCYLYTKKDEIMNGKNPYRAGFFLDFLKNEVPDEIQLEDRLDVLMELNTVASEAVS